MIFDPAQKDRILKTYTEIASAKPVPKPQRIPGFNKPPAKKAAEEKDKAQPDKPEEAKP